MPAELRFDFYEKVVVSSAHPAKAEIDGRLGAVLGRACGDDGLWSYAVSMYDSGICWCCWETELRPTGEFDSRDTFFDGSSVHVSLRGEVLDAEHRPTRCCDECGSDYLATSSRMAQLCPECSHWLYDYPRCVHEFTDGRCSKCGWDGSISEYVRRLQEQQGE